MAKVTYKERRKFNPNNIFDTQKLVSFLDPLIRSAKDDRTIVKAITEEYRSSTLFHVIKQAEKIIYN